MAQTLASLPFQMGRLYNEPIEPHSLVGSAFTYTNKESIPLGIRYRGMQTYDYGEDKRYVLIGGVDNSNWEELGLNDLDSVTSEGNTTANSLTIGGLTVNGDVVINGSTIQVNSEINTTDAVLDMNAGEVGAGITLGFSGLQLNRGTEDNFFFGFDEVRDRFTVGRITALSAAQIATTQVVATREDNPIDRGLAFYDSVSKRFNTLGTATVDASGNITANNLNVSDWNAAYSWGNHALQNYAVKNAVNIFTERQEIKHTSTSSVDALTFKYEHFSIHGGLESRIKWLFGNNSTGHQDSYNIAGYIAMGKSGGWTHDPDRDSYLAFAITENNVVREALRLSPTGNIISNNGVPLYTNSLNSNDAKLAFLNNSSVVGYIGANSTYGFQSFSSSGNPLVQLSQVGGGTFNSPHAGATYSFDGASSSGSIATTVRIIQSGSVGAVAELKSGVQNGASPYFQLVTRQTGDPYGQVETMLAQGNSYLRFPRLATGGGNMMVVADSIGALSVQTIPTGGGGGIGGSGSSGVIPLWNADGLSLSNSILTQMSSEYFRVGNSQNAGIRMGVNVSDYAHIGYSGGQTYITNGWASTSAYIRLNVNGQTKDFYGSGTEVHNRTSEGYFIYGRVNGNNAYSIDTIPATTAVRFDTQNARPLILSSAGNNNITLNNDGSINLLALTTINVGGIKFFQQWASYHSLSDSNGRIALYLGGADPANYYDNDAHYFRAVATGTIYATINSSGITAINFISTSDSRLKTETGEVKGLEWVKKLQPKLYDKKGITEMGFFADYIAKDDELGFMTSKGEDGYYALSYTNLHATSIKAIQEIDTEVDKLKKRVDVLEKENNQLKQQLNN